MDSTSLQPPDGCVGKGHFDRPIPVPPHLAGREGMIFVQIFVRAAEDLCELCVNMIASAIPTFPEVREPILEYAVAVGNRFFGEGTDNGVAIIPQHGNFNGLDDEQQDVAIKELLRVCCHGVHAIEQEQGTLHHRIAIAPRRPQPRIQQPRAKRRRKRRR